MLYYEKERKKMQRGGLGSLSRHAELNERAGTYFFGGFYSLAAVV